MTTETPTPPSTGAAAPGPSVRTVIGRISRAELAIGAAIAIGLAVLVILEPDIVEAPFQNGRTLLFTVGGTVVAGAALVAMLWWRVPAVVRVVALVVPFAIVNWWLLSPYFVDDVVDEAFVTSIAEQRAAGGDPAGSPLPTEPSPTTEPPPTTGPPTTGPPTTGAPTTAPPAATSPTTEPPPPAPSGPVLLGAGRFVGLAGHSGTGDAGIFENPDGSLVLRFENFDIQNGPDLEVYLVPGPDQTSLPEGSIHLGALKGNVGDQTYELPPGTRLTAGAYTALVWCRAFTVEFVGATIPL